MPPLLAGGKIDPASTPLTTGVTKELEPHHRRLREEEEKMRAELDAKQEKLRRQLREWDRLERESRAWELKSELSEKSLKNIAGEGTGGAAF
jgi:Skp family chaperone for outer membrane proteins